MSHVSSVSAALGNVVIRDTKTVNPGHSAATNFACDAPWKVTGTRALSESENDAFWAQRAEWDVYCYR